MYVHSEQRRNSQSKAFILLPSGPRSYRDTRFFSRSSEPLGLQVRGFCCPLQQRVGSGQVSNRVTPRGRDGGDGRVIPLNSFKGKLESRAKAASSASRRKMTPEVGRPTVDQHRINESAEAPTMPCNNERQARLKEPGSLKVAELHLYLPSSLCEDEEQDAEAEDMRSSAKITNVQEFDVRASNAGSLVFPTQQRSAEHNTPQHTGLRPAEM
ncbi:uncharacterized protein [Channa argus]|uniref:uncharacterized protein n=1 Tax=Channa argus TaxID=215402 RepID=UPI002946E3E2|nr:hypothetical protein Q8A73_012342 [Channa argus]